MKNKIVFGILLFIALSITVASASASMFPMVVYGDVVLNGKSTVGRPVTLTDLNTNYQWKTYTGWSGKYSVTLNNVKDNTGTPIAEGHQIQIDVCDYNLDKDCRKVITASTTPQEVSWKIDVGEESIPDVVCPECNCPTCEECQESDDGIIAGASLWEIIASVLAGLGALGTAGYFVRRKEAISKGVGIKMYQGRDGTQKVYHKHPGIRGYHDPLTRHREENERHLKGQLMPKYEKDENGVWNYAE